MITLLLIIPIIGSLIIAPMTEETKQKQIQMKQIALTTS